MRGPFTGAGRGSVLAVMKLARQIERTFEQEPALLMADIMMPLARARAADRRFNCLDSVAREALSGYAETSVSLVRRRYGDVETDFLVARCDEDAAGMDSDTGCEAMGHRAIGLAEEAQSGRRDLSRDLMGELERYCRLASAYYIERQCRFLRRRQRRTLWEWIAGMHYTLLDRTLVGVSEAKHLAEMAPDLHAGCGGEASELVRSAFHELATRG